ncbi:hypothetical protein OG943_32685 [Amycolatopsis sp. NBC_00345]|uniref:hypothetical protein n=1 Tax=Amycolatopsis sp. NBC_00345 TaxID=2975955 RepID=UPI002E25A2C8
MSDAVAGSVALAAEYNKALANIRDLDARLRALEGATSSSLGRIAGSRRTAGVGPAAFTTETLLQAVTFTVQTGRRYRVTMDYQYVGSDTSYFGVWGRYAAGPTVTNTGTQFYYRDTSPGSPGNWEGPRVITAETTGLPAGQVTIGFFVRRTSGSGTNDFRADTGQPAFMWVDDVGI